MECRYINDISDKWVEEKRDCINPREKLMARRIENLFRKKGKGDGSIYSGYPYELGTDTLHTFRRAKDWK